jgi:hypothetical protein
MSANLVEQLNRSEGSILILSTLPQRTDMNVRGFDDRYRARIAKAVSMVRGSQQKLSGHAVLTFQSTDWRLTGLLFAQTEGEGDRAHLPELIVPRECGTKLKIGPCRIRRFRQAG